MKVGRWIIISVCNYRSRDGHLLYNAKCSVCGFKKYGARLYNLKKTSSCNHFKIVGWTEKELSNTYRKMLERCYNVNSKDYKFYGKKGISVCDEWLKNPKSFIDWSIKTGYKKYLTIDRINTKGNYCPENCRWLTKSDNAKLKSTTRLLTINKNTNSISGWAKTLNIPKTTLITKLKNKTDEEAISYIKNYSRIVQREERLTVNQEVVGAEPTAGANKKNGGKNGMLK